MSAICEADAKAVLGEVDPLVLRELVRTRATAEEMARAVAFVRDTTVEDFSACRSLPPRVQRLVDLLSVTELGNDGGRSRAA